MNNDEKTIERLARLEQAFIDMKERFDDFLGNHFKTLSDKVNTMCNKMSQPRLPLWATFIITALCSLCVGLIVSMVKE